MSGEKRYWIECAKHDTLHLVRLYNGLDSWGTHAISQIKEGKGGPSTP